MGQDGFSMWRQLTKIVLAFWAIVGLSYAGCAQEVEHNFTVGPGNTSCDSLNVADTSNLITAVRKTKFRFFEELKISRYKTPRHVSYFSCDGKSGYLIAKETDKKEVIIEGVDIEDWKSVLNSRDPIMKYQALKKRYLPSD